MKKAKNYNKKRAAIVLTGTLAFTGAVSAIPMPMLGNPMAAVVYAADATNYSSDHAWSRCCSYERCHCKRA